MKLCWRLPSRNKRSNLAAKLAVSILLVGLAVTLLFSRSEELSPNVVNAVAEKSEVTKSTESDDVSPQLDSTSAGDGNASADVCDLFSGDWIPYHPGPLYTNKSCSWIFVHQNCIGNGRPDNGYLYWTWKPRNCELPPFDGRKFLEFMRNKAWALIGDSISRNHVQSLLCMLSTVEQPIIVYHDEEYKSVKWHFLSYNFNISVIWAPFLVKAAIFEDYNGVSTSSVQLHLDKLDTSWTSLYPNMDYMILSTGKWFLKTAIYYENDSVVGCYNCSNGDIPEMGFEFAYRKTLHDVMNFIAKSKHKGLIFLRTSTPDHFENGEWDTEGTCPGIAPVKGSDIQLKVRSRILHDIELNEYEKASVVAAKNGVNLKLLDFTNLLLTRPDGHPGPYRQFFPFAKDKNAKVQNDCLHWCLPGPIDALNDVIMEIVMNAG